MCFLRFMNFNPLKWPEQIMETHGGSLHIAHTPYLLKGIDVPFGVEEITPT